MSTSVDVTTGIPEGLAVDLDWLAAQRDRSPAWSIEKAIAGSAREELASPHGLRTADATIDGGDFMPDDRFMAALQAEAGARRAAWGSSSGASRNNAVRARSSIT